MCNAKIEIGKHSTPASTYKGLMKEFYSPNNKEYKFWFCPDDIKCYVCGSMKKCVELAYSAQHVAGEDKYQSIEEGGCGI